MNDFKKSHRLVKKADIDFVFSNALKQDGRGFLLLFRHNQVNTPRLGIIIAKKHVPKAHDRNRLRRVVRETFRNIRCHIKNFDIIFLARSDLKNLDNRVLRNSLFNCFKLM